jgi:hypothetical protein
VRFSTSTPIYNNLSLSREWVTPRAAERPLRFNALPSLSMVKDGIEYNKK